MVVLLIVLGILAAIAAAGLSLFTAGEAVAVVAAVVVIAIVLSVLIFARNLVRLAVLAVAIIFVAVIGYGGYEAYNVYASLSDNAGPVEPADPAALASANEKLDAAAAAGSFRIEMTAAELRAVLQDALASNKDNPLKRVDLTVIDGKPGENGHLDFKGAFKNGSINADGSIDGKVEAGRIKFVVRDVSLGAFTVPGLAKGAVEDLIQTVTDMNKKLDEHNATIQSLDIGGGKITITGVQGAGGAISVAALLDGVKSNVAALGAKTTPPVETLGPGTVDAKQASGSRYFVAIGDSLAANVGVPSAKDGYVSRLHKQLVANDGVQYGLQNFGVSGQTSAGLINAGQLDAAVKFMRANDVAYVSMDIGANDLLGHLYSADCQNALEDAACQQRVKPALVAYEANLNVILSRIKDAAPKATIIFLGTYNPFSIGFGTAVKLEGTSDSAVEAMNAVAAKVTAARGIKFADGQAVMKGRTGAVTHMLEQPPDIHPKAIGYDLLAAAMLAALK